MGILRHIFKILTALLLSTNLNAMECKNVEPCQDVMSLIIGHAKLHELPQYFLLSKSWLQLADNELFWADLARKYFGNDADKFKVENESWRTSIKNHIQRVSKVRNLKNWKETDIANVLNEGNYSVTVEHLYKHLDIKLIEIASPKVCDVVELFSVCIACFAVNQMTDYFERLEICESAGEEVMDVLSASGNIPFAAATIAVSEACQMDGTKFTQREKDLQYLMLLAYLSSDEYLEKYFFCGFEGAKKALEHDRWQFIVGSRLAKEGIDNLAKKKWRCLSKDHWTPFQSIIERLAAELEK